MPEKHLITPDNFRLLLGWLNENEEEACAKYEQIRRRLVRLFICRGCTEPEHLADVTIDRVTSKVPVIVNGYEGDPVLYFYGVANKVNLEWHRKQSRQGPSFTRFLPTEIDESDADDRRSCLEACLQELSPTERELIIEYYEYDKSEKIERRKELARRMGSSIGALHVRVSRLRSRLQECLKKCSGETH